MSEKSEHTIHKIRYLSCQEVCEKILPFARQWSESKRQLEIKVCSLAGIAQVFSPTVHLVGEDGKWMRVSLIALWNFKQSNVYWLPSGQTVVHLFNGTLLSNKRNKLHTVWMSFEGWAEEARYKGGHSVWWHGTKLGRDNQIYSDRNRSVFSWSLRNICISILVVV